MKPSLIDTDILSLFFRNHPEVTDRFSAYLATHDKINISIITYYEILSGLKHRDANKKMALFLEFASTNSVLPLTESSVNISSQIYADMRRSGNPLDDIDILIAGVAIANDLKMVTRNRRHFGRINGLEVEDWSESKSAKPPNT